MSMKLFRPLNQSEKGQLHNDEQKEGKQGKTPATVVSTPSTLTILHAGTSRSSINCEMRNLTQKHQLVKVSQEE